GIGRMQYGGGDAGDGGTRGPLGSYPWITSNTRDIDITRFRRPVSDWRAIVLGPRHAPHVPVRPPQHHAGPSTLRGGWSFTDAIASWSWPGFEGKPITVEVYADADEVELLVNGTAVGRAAVGDTHPYLASIDTTYVPGELTAIAFRDGAEAGRIAL